MMHLPELHLESTRRTGVIRRLNGGVESNVPGELIKRLARCTMLCDKYPGTCQRVVWPEQICGMLLGFFGMLAVFFLRGGDQFTGGKASFLIGDLMAVAAGIFWSAFTVLGENAVRRYGSPVIMCGAFLFGALVMIPVMALAGSRITFAIDLRGWLMILYIGIVANALANVCWYAALKHLKPGGLGSFGYVSIILTVVLAFCFLGEKITLPFVLCPAMILLGTGMMLKISSSDNRQQKRKIS